MENKIDGTGFSFLDKGNWNFIFIIAMALTDYYKNTVTVDKHNVDSLIDSYQLWLPYRDGEIEEVSNKILAEFHNRPLLVELTFDFLNVVAASMKNDEPGIKQFKDELYFNLHKQQTTFEMLMEIIESR